MNDPYAATALVYEKLVLPLIILITGTNEEMIIKVLVDHNNDQRQAIKAAYKTLFGKVRCIQSFLFIFHLFIAF